MGNYLVRKHEHRPKLNWKVLNIGHWSKFLVEIMTY